MDSLQRVLRVEQKITKVTEGANVYGVYVNNLSVPAYSAADPPSGASVLAYLTQISKPRPVPDANSDQRALWNVPVDVLAGEFGSGTKDLWVAVQEVFTQQSPDDFIQRVLLLGEAGMGRTPALFQLQSKAAEQSKARLQKRIAKKYVKKPATWNRDAYILPFYISLAHIRSGYDLPTLIRDSYNNNVEAIHTINLEQVVALMKRYKCLFLLDDLELILTSNQPGAIEAVNHFMESNAHQYVMACRTSGDWRQMGPVSRLYLADFPGAVARKLLGEERYQRLCAVAPSLILDRSSLHKILGGVVTDIHNQSNGLLIQQDIRDRLNRHRDVLKARKLDQLLVERLLERLALTMHLERTSTLSEWQVMTVITDYLEEWRDKKNNWRDLVLALDEIEMLECNQQLRIWSFRHQRAQAYFAAAALLADPAQLQTVLDDVSDFRWRPVLELLTGLFSDPSGFVFDLIDRDALVAALCTDAARNSVDPWIASAVIDALLERMKQESSLRRQTIIERIGMSDHPRAQETLLLALYQEWSSKVVASIVFAILEWGASHPKASISNIETKILRSSARQHERVADVLLLCETCWKFKGGKQRQRAIDELIQIVEDANRSPRTRGLATIGLGIACTSETRKLLLDLLTRNDLDDFVAWCGVEAIRLLKDHSGVELAIITLCDDKEHQDEQWARNRARAVYLLGYLRQDSSTAERLRLGLQDSSPFVRGCAVEALAQMDLRTGAARRRIELLLDDEIDPQVLRKIAEALGHIGVASTIARLQPFLQCDVARTRWAMRQAIDDIAARHMS